MMKNNSKGFVPIIILIIAILIVGGVYFLANSSHLKNEVKVTPSPVPTPTKIPWQKPAGTSVSLKNYLTKYCDPYNNPQEFDASSLFLSVDVKKLTSIFNDKVVLNCLVSEGSLEILASNNKASSYGRINVYNDKTQELGHGGPSFIDPLEGKNYSPYKKVFDDGNNKVFSLILGGEGEQLAGEVKVSLMGSKKIVLKNGDIVKISYMIVGISGDDERLLKIIKPLSKDNGYGQLAIQDSGKVDAEINSYFFSTKPSSETPEGKAMDEILAVLSAISAR